MLRGFGLRSWRPTLPSTVNPNPNPSVYCNPNRTVYCRYIPEATGEDLSEEVVKIDLNQGTAKTLETLTQYPVSTRVSLSGTLVVARDIAHAKVTLFKRCLNSILTLF